MWYLVQRKKKNKLKAIKTTVCVWIVLVNYKEIKCGFTSAIASNKVLRFQAHQADILPGPHAACLDPCSVENEHSIFSLSFHSSLFHLPKICQAQ